MVLESPWLMPEMAWVVGRSIERRESRCRLIRPQHRRVCGVIAGLAVPRPVLMLGLRGRRSAAGARRLIRCPLICLLRCRRILILRWQPTVRHRLRRWLLRVLRFRRRWWGMCRRWLAGSRRWWRLRLLPLLRW